MLLPRGVNLTFPVSSLKSKLKKQSTATGSGVARAFLRTQAALFGSYRDALRYKPGEPVTFCEESFVNHRSSAMRSFLEMAVNLQLFKQFIEGRLAKLNAGRGFTDIFEEEITEGGFCGSNSRSYQQWMQTVKKGGAFINTAVNKASPAMAKRNAKQGIKEVKSMLKQKEADEGDLAPCSGSPTSTKSLSPKRVRKRKVGLTCTSLEVRRKQKHRAKAHMNVEITKFHTHIQTQYLFYCLPVLRNYYKKTTIIMGCPDFALNEDELDTASKISSEDSGELRSYNGDSDDSDSNELNVDTQHSGQMDLLGEILDTLSTHSSDHGKLSGAKSLDFFRSMDDIDYKTANKSNTPSESNLAQFCTGESEQMGWNLGQDDSALHGKHLPPSPKRKSCGGQRDFLHIVTEEKNVLPCTLQNQDLPEITVNFASPADSQDVSCSIVRRNVLRRQTLKSHPENALQDEHGKRTARQPSILVPWEKGDTQEEDLIAGRDEKGLLEEIESVYHLSSAFHTDLQISEVNSKAREEI
ncbi:DEN1A protein, partial [Atractosteus spatula]|nr:DEN1A protein [Atractosteus spatula]